MMEPSSGSEEPLELNDDVRKVNNEVQIRVLDKSEEIDELKKKFPLKIEMPLRELDDVVYTRTAKERYIRVSGYKFRWDQKLK